MEFGGKEIGSEREEDKGGLGERQRERQTGSVAHYFLPLLVPFSDLDTAYTPP